MNDLSPRYHRGLIDLRSSRTSIIPVHGAKALSVVRSLPPSARQCKRLQKLQPTTRRSRLPSYSPDNSMIMAHRADMVWKLLYQRTENNDYGGGDIITAPNHPCYGYQNKTMEAIVIYSITQQHWLQLATYRAPAFSGRSTFDK